MCKITVLMITVRPDNAFVNHPDWHVMVKVIEDLNAQTFKDFELVVVDGLALERDLQIPYPLPNFRMTTLGPKKNIWTKHKKCCISNYRNTGLAWARGELVVNIDDCCTLPPLYLELFWRAWSEKRVCLSSTWMDNGDHRIGRNNIRDPGQVYVSPQRSPRGGVYGFGSYPLEMALDLNGYDEAYDGGMYLEDIDWSSRLHDFGLPMYFAYIPGFRLHDQSGHDPSVIDRRSIVKCCNAAYQTNQVWRTLSRVNTPDLWTDESLARLLGPCAYMSKDGKHKCGHWNNTQTCAYINPEYLDENGKSFALERDPIAALVLDHPPVRDLRKERAENGQ